MVAGRSAGNWDSTLIIASIPPAEAPMTTTSRVCFSVLIDLLIAYLYHEKKVGANRVERV
jgi:hypothetical protein